MNRREFICAGALSAAAFAADAPGLNGLPTVAVIGFGPQGRGLLRQFLGLKVVVAALAAVASVALAESAAVNLPTLKVEWTQKLEELVAEGLPAKPSSPRRLLVFYRTDGFCHRESIVAGNEAIRIAAEKAKAWKVDFSDEIYMQAAPYFSRQALHVLVSLDLDDDATKSALERSDVRRRPDNDYAVSWVRRFGGGRVFYTSFGHDERAWLNGPTLKHILGGIQYALRDISTDESPSSPQFVNPSKK